MVWLREELSLSDPEQDSAQTVGKPGQEGSRELQECRVGSNRCWVADKPGRSPRRRRRKHTRECSGEPVQMGLGKRGRRWDGNQQGRAVHIPLEAGAATDPAGAPVHEHGHQFRVEWINLTRRLLRQFASLVVTPPSRFGNPRGHDLRIRSALGFNPAGERGGVGLLSTRHDQVFQRRGRPPRTPRRRGSHRRPRPERSRRPIPRQESTRSRSKVVAVAGDAVLNGSATDPERGTENSLSEAGCGPCHDHGGLPGRSVSHHGR